MTKSIYTKARNKSNTQILINNDVSPIKQLKKTGYWNTTSLLGDVNFFPDCYSFNSKEPGCILGRRCLFVMLTVPVGLICQV